MRIAAVFLAFLMAGGAVFASDEDDLAELALSASHNITAGRYDDGLKALDRAMKAYPKSPNIDLIYGLTCKAYAGKKGFDQAIAYCSAAILRNPNNPIYYADRAGAYYWTGDRVSARRDADATLAMGAKSAAVYGLKARLFWEEGEIAKAKVACWQATRLDRREPNAHFVLAAILNRKKPPKAVSPSVAPSPRAVQTADDAPGRSAKTPPAISPLDCRNVAAAAEKAICRDAALRNRERTVYRLYERAFTRTAAGAAMDAAQRNWIAAVRNACKTRACFLQAYSSREGVLKLWLAD